MGILTGVIDRIWRPTPELTAARKALVTLWDHSAVAEAVGVQDETPEYLRLSGAVNDALSGHGPVFQGRAVGGAYDIRDRRGRDA